MTRGGDTPHKDGMQSSPAKRQAGSWVWIAKRSFFGGAAGR